MTPTWPLVTKTLEALSPLLFAVLTWLAIEVRKLIIAKTKSEHIQSLLIRLDDAVFAAVKEVQLVIVEQLKAVTADGRLTPEDRRQVKDAALVAIRTYLGSQGLSEAARVLSLGSDDFDKFLSARIESALYELRGSAPKVLNGAAHP